MKNILILPLAFLALVFTNCNDGSTIGSELLENEVIDLQFDDDFILAAQTVLGDSVATYRVTAANQTYMLGEIDEPIFGKYSSDIYTGITFNAAFPDYNNSQLDSIVLDLEYDLLGFYGDTTVVHNIEVFRVIEDFFEIDSIFSDRSFMTDPDPLASISIVPSTYNTISVKHRDLDVDSTIVLSPRLRIRLDGMFGRELLFDSAAQVSDSALIASFKGFHIKSTTEGNSIIGLNFNENPDFNNGIARLHMYYTKTNSGGEPFPEDYSYLLRNVTSSMFVHDYDGSVVGSSLNDKTKGEDFIFVQNMAGVNAEIDIPDLSFLYATDTIIVNKAELVLTVIEDQGEFLTEDYPPSIRYILSKDTDDGNRILLEDLTKPNIAFSDALLIFDGAIRDVEQEDQSLQEELYFTVRNTQPFLPS